MAWRSKLVKSFLGKAGHVFSDLIYLWTVNNLREATEIRRVLMAAKRFAAVRNG
jgi:hypothetical protein